jgi:hypothetical protein
MVHSLGSLSILGHGGVTYSTPNPCDNLLDHFANNFGKRSITFNALDACDPLL